jgi:hypothetical protein
VRRIERLDRSVLLMWVTAVFELQIWLPFAGVLFNSRVYFPVFSILMATISRVRIGSPALRRKWVIHFAGKR